MLKQYSLASELGADQQHDHVGVGQGLVDALGPLVAGEDLAIVPALDQPLALEPREVRVELLPVPLIAMAVTDEQFRHDIPGAELPRHFDGRPELRVFL